MMCVCVCVIIVCKHSVHGFVHCRAYRVEKKAAIIAASYTVDVLEAVVVVLAVVLGMHCGFPAD